MRLLPRKTRPNIGHKLQYATVLAPSVPAAPAVLGPIIQNNMVRHVTKVSVDLNGIVGPTFVLVMSGTAGVPVNNHLQINADPGLGFTPVVGQMDSVPTLVFRPVTSVFPTAENQILVQSMVAASPVNITIEYYDTRG